MALIQDWKTVTVRFEDPCFWTKRIQTSHFTDETDFEKYLKQLHEKAPSPEEIVFLTEILQYNHHLSEEFIKKQTGHFASVLECSLLSISGILGDIYNDFHKELEIVLNVNATEAGSSVRLAIQKEIFKILRPVASYEYFVYLEAYGLENKQESLLQFVLEASNSNEWIEYLFEAYPVLLSVLFKFRSFFEANLNILCSRLKSDWKEIKQEFDLQGIKALTDINLFLGDPHKGWQTTASFSILDENNEPQTIYYKPKNLTGDAFINNISSFLQNLGLPKSFELPATIVKQNYAWQKGVAYQPAMSRTAVAKFFFRQGINLALAYVLNIQDLIADNILVNGDFPVFFDLEMLMLPTVKNGNDYKTSSSGGREYLESIIKTGLVPSLGFETVNNKGFSNSGLSKVSGNTYTVYENRNNASTLKPIKVISADNNLPKYENKTYEVKDHYHELVEGFNTAWELMVKHQSQIVAFLKEQQLLLADVQCRILIRFTHVYTSMLNESYYPSYMGNYYEYNKLFELVWRGYDGFYVTEQILQSEIKQLSNNEVPYFYSNPVSKSLMDADGNILAEDFFASTGLESCIRKVQNLNTDTQRQQLNILKRALYIYGNVSDPVDYSTSVKKSETIRDDLPLSIGEFLMHLNRSPAEEPYFSYIDFTLTKDDLWDQGIQGPDLFQGIGGLGIFFAALYKQYKDDRYLAAATKIFDQSVEYFISNRDFLLDSPLNKIGVVSFPISIVYAGLTSNEILLDDRFSITEATLDSIIDFLSRKISSDKFFDYLSGVTGPLLIFLKMYEQRKDASIYQIIRALADHLANGSHEVGPDMISWKKPFFDQWGGFAHGNSSASYALFKAAALLQDSRYHDCAIKALNYDQSLFDPKKQIWRKSRDFEGDIHHSWGNGSAGIGLSRKLISNYYVNDFLLQEIEIAKINIDKYLPMMISNDHSIGSGFLGMLELRKFIDPSFDHQLLLQKFMQEIDVIKKLKCGGWSENPLVTGLFYGLAGIGYNIMKLTSNESLPSLLWI
ncbi:type 2 lantipeptide synthetase LanM family protein [Mucilaginibacter sp. Bleaf8]|uniref:type 2 lanthipeptide synthetase LanM family protein n=1 Tax=Mucilaginibacter sp. Bleaf8 TaxID=2834430 RepID=UPI001BCC4C80|nr:type 2 lanthipeptide synthetase LanM family protein [Mucilaginibacter sp. Bleaf8]MBS7565723.1 type 2 lantipeptide synthetase LanM family protein [Mucilaginibacter sp. Bleaf8]